MMDLKQYRSIVFDCDGVILDSNRAKTQAFLECALPYGEAAAQKIVQYHKANPSQSRYEKIEFFCKHILSVTDVQRHQLSLLKAYSARAREAMLACRLAPGLDQLRKYTPQIRWAIVSASDEVELREVLQRRGIAEFFDAGVYGSPTKKAENIARLLSDGLLETPALYLGDSLQDFELARTFRLDFVFVYEWTETEYWQEFCQVNSVRLIRTVGDLFASSL